jgi:hypothetical protein
MWTRVNVNAGTNNEKNETKTDDNDRKCAKRGRDIYITCGKLREEGNIQYSMSNECKKRKWKGRFRRGKENRKSGKGKLLNKQKTEGNKEW